jgi:hypothetical protein
MKFLTKFNGLAGCSAPWVTVCIPHPNYIADYIAHNSSSSRTDPMSDILPDCPNAASLSFTIADA